jgi:hypothetical protein
MRPNHPSDRVHVAKVSGPDSGRVGFGSERSGEAVSGPASQTSAPAGATLLGLTRQRDAGVNLHIICERKLAICEW